MWSEKLAWNLSHQGKKAKTLLHFSVSQNLSLIELYTPRFPSHMTIVTQPQKVTKRLRLSLR